MDAMEIKILRRSMGGMSTTLLMLILAGAGTGTRCDAQAVSPPPAEGAPAPQGVVIDQIVAVVNGDLVLESDVDEERRFQAFQPIASMAQTFTREKIIERLVDRMLILQQEKLQPQPKIPDTEVAAELVLLRKEIPACKEYHCDTDAGWQKFVADQGFTMDELIDRWRDRMEVLRFIELRFKMGIRITPEEIKTYYDKTLVPALVQRKAAVPKLSSISDRIQEILLQQQVGSLLEDWLTSLKAQGTVRMATAREVQP